MGGVRGWQGDDITTGNRRGAHGQARRLPAHSAHTHPHTQAVSNARGVGATRATHRVRGGEETGEGGSAVVSPYSDSDCSAVAGACLYALHLTVDLTRSDAIRHRCWASDRGPGVCAIVSLTFPSCTLHTEPASDRSESMLTRLTPSCDVIVATDAVCRSADAML